MLMMIKTNNNNATKSNILIDSKSDIYKTGFSHINKNETQNISKDIINQSPTDENKKNKDKDKDIELNKNDKNDNNIINEDNKEMPDPLLGATALKNLGIDKEPNNELLNDILRNVDTSQTFIRKNKANKSFKLNMNNNLDENSNNNFTKNLNDMIKNVNINTNISQSFRVGENTGISNILKDVHTSQTMVKRNDNEINKIFGDVNSSQTMNKKKDQEINDILKDVETTDTNFNKINNNNINDINQLNKKGNIQNLQSIDDIRKMFNNDYPNNNNMNNLYENNNIKDSRINNIFKNELISSDSRFLSNGKGKGPDKPVIPKFSQNYGYNYDKGSNDNDNNNNIPYKLKGQNNKYIINPKHMNKINAIINLLEELNLENLLHVKNQIIKQLESKK